jgi:short-subunit dehydrogenase
MPKSIAVFGAGPGLGQAVARRYAQEGYDIVLVARRRQSLNDIARDVTATGANAHVLSADLVDIEGIPALAEQIRGAIGELDSMYFAPTPAQGFVSATELTPQRAQDFMPLIFYSLIAMVQQFLPQMIEKGSGAILTAQGTSSIHGLPYMSGSGPAQAAQRNYLQSLHAEVSDQGIFVGMLYVGALIENSAFHAETERARASGTGRDWGPTVNSAHLAELLWNMDRTKSPMETIYPGRGDGH